ncbi:MAG: hypothetical protein KIT66_08435 [Chitinophagaceae bacterium]|nr:hypothetical protein [Chitinophagaceae bacterium]
MKIIQQAGLSLALLISAVSVQSQSLSKNTYGQIPGHQSGWTFGAGSGGAFGLKSGEAGLFRGNSFATKVFGSYYFGKVGLSGTTGVIGGAVDNGALHSFIKERGMQPEDLSIHEAKPSNSFLMIGPSVRFGSRFLVNAGLQGGVFLNNPGSINVSNIGSAFPIYRIEGTGKNAFPGFSGNISLHYPLGNSFHVFLEGSYLQSRTTTNLTDPKNGIDMPMLVTRDLRMATAGIGITKSFGSSRSENKHKGKPNYGNLTRNDANSCGTVLLTITNSDGSVERLEFENPDGALAYYESRAAKLKAMKEGTAGSNTSNSAAQGNEANESTGKVGYTLEYPDGSIERIVFACAADAAYYSARKGWDGSVKGNSKVTEETALRKGWDGSVKGNAITTEEAARKGWDGSVKGNAKATEDAARKGWDGSVKGNAITTEDAALRKGWDGSVKGNAITTEEAARKGWDGSVKGNSKVTEETALRKGWDGSVKGNSKVTEANQSNESKKRANEDGYNPWELEEPVEGTVMNPIRGSQDSAQSQRETGVILGNIFWGDGNLPGIKTNQMAVSSKNNSKTETQIEDGVKIIFREAGDPSCADCEVIANASYSGKGNPLYQSQNNTHENPLYRGNKLGGNNPPGQQTNSKAVNPLYEESGKSGDNPMFEPKGSRKNNPLYQEGSKGENPLYESNALREQNGGICGATSHFVIVLVSPVTGRQIARTTADDCGGFWFTNVPAGKYGIRIYGNVISHEVYDVSVRKDNAKELAGHLLVSDRQLMVQLNTKFGESRQEGYVVMRGWSSMNGEFSENESGDHTSGNQRVAGQPIRGIIVKGGRNPPGQIQTVQTDDNGRFSFGNMAKGNYIITADIPFYVDEKVLISLGIKEVWGDPHENLNGKLINEESKGSARGAAQDFNTTRSNRERGQDLATNPGGNNPSSTDTGKSAIGQAQDFNTTRSNRERGQDLATNPGGNNPSSADTGKSAIGQAQDFNTTRSNRERGQDLATNPGGNDPSSADTGKSAIGQAQDFNTTRSNRERGQDLATNQGGNNPSSTDTGKLAIGQAQDFNTTRSNRERGQDLATNPGGNNPSSADTGKSAIGQAQDFNTTRSNRERGQDLATNPGGNNPSSADTGKSAIGQAQDFNTTRSNRERGQDLAKNPGGNNSSSADTGKSSIGQAQDFNTTRSNRERGQDLATNPGGNNPSSADTEKSAIGQAQDFNTTRSNRERGQDLATNPGGNDVSPSGPVRPVDYKAHLSKAGSDLNGMLSDLSSLEKKLNSDRKSSASAIRDTRNQVASLKSKIAAVQQALSRTSEKNNVATIRDLNAAMELLNVQTSVLQKKLSTMGADYADISTEIKTKHDTMKNSISNVR